MKRFKTVCLLYLVSSLIVKAQPPCNPSTYNLLVTPNQALYCTGSNIAFLLSTPHPIVGVVNWTSGAAAITQVPSGTARINFNITGLTGGGQVTASGIIKPGGVNCTFSKMFAVVSIPSPVAQAGPDMIITGNPNYATIGGSPSATGGAQPYTYAWLPNANFVNSTSATNSNPQVNPSTTTNYQLTVTDQNNCTSTDNVMVYNASGITNNKCYAVLKKELDAGYYNSINLSGTNTLYFKFDEEYYAPAGTNLTYKLFNDAGTQITTTPALTETIGDNRFSLNVAGLSVGYYRIYVYNQKNEVWQSRIKIN
jgi:hypothetical protein